MPDDLAPLIDKLRALKPELAASFGVEALAVFGSRTRGQARPESDLDVLVTFAPDARPTLFSLARLDARLSEALGVRVETVEEASLNPRYAPYIRPELVAV